MAEEIYKYDKKMLKPRMTCDPEGYSPFLVPHSRGFPFIVILIIFYRLVGFPRQWRELFIVRQFSWQL